MADDEQKLLLICPDCPGAGPNDRMRSVLERALEGVPYDTVTRAAQLQPVHGRRVLFALPLDEAGMNLEFYAMLHRIRSTPSFFRDSVAALVVDGQLELYTKDFGRTIAFALNQAGCLLIGRPLVEGTGSLRNFDVLAGIHETDRMGAYLWSVQDVVQRLRTFAPPRFQAPNLLVLHASSNHKTSNTLALWHMVQPHLTGVLVRQIDLGNGVVRDCRGCNYATCLHLGQQNSCFYGGTMVDEVYPAMEQCDGLLLLCPNYNDALGANLTACINRLTALYRKAGFQNKYLFAIIVSGYSGGDIVAKQLISALNMNKGLLLPGRFALFATANNPGSVCTITEVGEWAQDFAGRIQRALGGGAASET